MKAPLIDFVVIARNNREIVGDTLAAIGRQGIGLFTCTLVDGCSTDGTPDLVRDRFPWVTVVVKPSDSGPADSRNIGFKNGSAEYVVFVDSDVVLDADWTRNQLALMRTDPRIALAGGKLLHAGDTRVLYAAYGVMTRSGIPWDGGRAQPAADFDRLHDCLWLNTSALAARRAALERLGGFDAAMFFGCEDSDLGWRANLLGWRVVFNPVAAAVHKVHGTFDPAVMKPRLLYFMWRNRLRSMLVNYGLRNLIRYGTMLVALSLADALAIAPRRAKLLALAWNVRRLRETLSRRRWVQRRRVRADRDLRPLFRTGWRGPGYAFAPRSRSFDERPSDDRIDSRRPIWCGPGSPERRP